MYLFIFESIGTSELILIGIVALIFLGPRRMPDLARKAGKIMTDLRSATSEFKETWEREVNFEEEAAALRNLDEPVPRQKSSHETDPMIQPASIDPPVIRQIEPSKIEELKNQAPEQPDRGPDISLPMADVQDKRNWL